MDEYKKKLMEIRSLSGTYKYQEEMAKTPIDKKAFGLRKEALRYTKMGRREIALQLYLQASNFYKEEDQSPAATTCWYDLAESYLGQSEGVRIENLLLSEKFYRRALASPALKSDLHRSALYRDGLARCLRQLSDHLDNKQDDERLDEAERLLQEAIDLAKKLDIAGLAECAQYLHSLANVFAQREKIDAALLLLDEAEVFQHRCQNEAPSESRASVLPSILYNSAVYRVQRNKPGDIEQAKKQLQEIIRLGHPKFIDKIYIFYSSIYLQEGNTEKAKEYIDKIFPARISTEQLPALVSIYKKVGLSDEAISLLYQRVDQAMKERLETIASHAADHQAAEAQQAAHFAARLLVEKNKHAEAFFILEYVSGLRYDENTSGFLYKHKSPVARELSNTIKSLQRLQIFSIRPQVALHIYMMTKMEFYRGLLIKSRFNLFKIESLKK